MLTLILAALAGTLAGLLTSRYTDHVSISILVGVVVFLAVTVAIVRVFAKRLTRVVEGVKQVMESTRDEVQRMANRFQSRPGASLKMMQKQTSAALEKGVRQALDVLEQARSAYRWIPFAERQVNSMKFQLYYQIKDWEHADALRDRIFLLDATTMAMKMAREHANGADTGKIEKLYRKGLRRFKYEKAVLVYATYSWILVQREEYDRAIEVLDEGREKTENETLQRNWQVLANQKPQQFSNAGLGDEWYALHLEEPPRVRAGKGHLKNHPLHGRGKRRRF